MNDILTEARAASLAGQTLTPEQMSAGFAEARALVEKMPDRLKGHIRQTLAVAMIITDGDPNVSVDMAASALRQEALNRSGGIEKLGDVAASAVYAVALNDVLEMAEQAPPEGPDSN